MRGHQHLGDPSLTQNQGNTLGDRPCVRQSRLYREHVGGNAMKDIMGQGELKWDTTQSQGAYAGKKVFDHNPGSRQRRGEECAPHQPQHIQQEQYGRLNNNNNNNNVGGGEEEEEYDEEEEVEISMDLPENTSPKVPQQQQQRETMKSQQQQQQQQQPPAGATPVASRGFRPGAGYANRQTYNIFTGQ